METSRGRVERRTLTTTTNIIDSGYLKWPGARQIIRLERETTVKNETTRTVTYAVTSLPRDQAGAPTLLRYSRGRWGIENSCFYVLDTVLGEDASRVRTGTAGVTLSGIRHAVLNFCRNLGQSAATVFREHLAKPALLFTRLRIM